MRVIRNLELQQFLNSLLRISRHIRANALVFQKFLLLEYEVPIFTAVIQVHLRLLFFNFDQVWEVFLSIKSSKQFINYFLVVVIEIVCMLFFVLTTFHLYQLLHVCGWQRFGAFPLTSMVEKGRGSFLLIQLTSPIFEFVLKIVYRGLLSNLHEFPYWARVVVHLRVDQILFKFHFVFFHSLVLSHKSLKTKLLVHLQAVHLLFLKNNSFFSQEEFEGSIKIDRKV